MSPIKIVHRFSFVWGIAQNFKYSTFTLQAGILC